MTARTFRLVVSAQLIIILSLLAVITAGDYIIAYLAEQPQTSISAYDTGH